MKTALVKNEKGNLKIFRNDEYKTLKEFENELKGNGFKVLKVWNGNKTNMEIEEWEFLNRK
jgi:hypothetical protein